MIHYRFRSLKIISGILFFCFFAISCQHSINETIILESLLEEMVSLDAMTRFPDPFYTCRQMSSYDRRSVSPDSAGWYANRDGWEGDNFLRIDTIEGRIEKVMFEEEGPGVITRIWITSLDKEPIMRFYLDDAVEPQWIIPAYDMTQIGVAGAGKGLVFPHTSYTEERGGSTSYMPIPYSNGCRVTIEIPDEVIEKPRYYQINYRKYDESALIETFSKEVVMRGREKIEEVNQLLLNPAMQSEAEISNEAEEKLNPGDSLSINLPKGENALYEISFNIDAPNSDEFARIMRELIFTASFDGKETVWVPLSDFSGGGIGALSVESWFLWSDGEGNMVCRWVMPYQKGGTIGLKNYSSELLHASVQIKTGSYKWDSRSLYFHASWKQENGLGLVSSGECDKGTCWEWNFCTLSGKGIYKGDLLTLYNYSKSWYGEGDEKIWVDDDTFPSHFGTGTEDYYNSSWAPVVVFHTPFGGAVRADSISSQGHNTWLRTRNLDGIPFKKGVQFDLELLSWDPGTADYSSTVYWYGDKNAGVTRTR